MSISLIELKNNRTARVLAISGGPGFSAKLQGLGIRVGSRIIKISHASGPVVVKTGSVQIAIGRGMAARIMVEEE